MEAGINPARDALTRAVNRAITEGAPIYENIADGNAIIQVGDRLYNGAIVTPQFAAMYNRLTARIKSFDVPPENLLNGRHNALVSFAECLNRGVNYNG